MTQLSPRLDAVDTPLTRWMARHGVPLLRISLGIVFLWFVALEPFPGLSPAQAPLVLFSGEVFTRISYAPSLEGQHVIRNAVLISAAIGLGATVRGGGLVAEPGAGAR